MVPVFSSLAAETGQCAERTLNQHSSTAAGANRININQATASELEALSGIGEKRAHMIVEYRESHGPFSREEDLVNVPGIGKGLLSRNLDRITVE